MDLSGAHRCSMMFRPQMFNVLFPLSYSTAAACWRSQTRERERAQTVTRHILSGNAPPFFYLHFPLCRRDRLGSEIIFISGTTMEFRCFSALAPEKGYFCSLNPRRMNVFIAALCDRVLRGRAVNSFKPERVDLGEPPLFEFFIRII